MGRKLPVGGMRRGDIAWQAYQAGLTAGRMFPLAAHSIDDLALLESGREAVSKAFREWWTERRARGVGACPSCGYDGEETITASWEFTIDRDPPSLNARIVNSGKTAYLYRKERTAWAWEFRAARLKLAIPKARGRRRVTFTRQFGGLQKVRDRDNFIGGMKGLVDAMVEEGLLLDDTMAAAELHYIQERAEPRGLVVLLEEFA